MTRDGFAVVPICDILALPNLTAVVLAVVGGRMVTTGRHVRAPNGARRPEASSGQQRPAP